MTIVSKEKVENFTVIEPDDDYFVPSDIPTAKFNELSQRKESTYVRHTLNDVNHNTLLVSTKKENSFRRKGTGGTGRNKVSFSTIDPNRYPSKFTESTNVKQEANGETLLK